MKRVILLLLLGLIFPVFASTGDTIPEFGHSLGYLGDVFSTSSVTGINTTRYIQEGGPVVFYGENVTDFSDLYDYKFALTGDTDSSTEAVALGVRLNGDLEHSLIIKGYEYSSTFNKTIKKWFENTYETMLSDSYPVLAIRTEVEYHEPYGILETRTELLKVNDTSSEFDWYDVTVTQIITPGVNSSGSDWGWGWITYTMNGFKGESNVFLSDYDPPQSNELPTGFFSFLWRILNFNPRNFVPWLYAEELKVEGIDKSDFSLETFTVRYQAPSGYMKSNEPLNVRHHYVLRVSDGVKPKFWQQTQVKYVKGNVIASPPYYSPLMHEGYLELR